MKIALCSLKGQYSEEKLREWLLYCDWLRINKWDRLLGGHN